MTGSTDSERIIAAIDIALKEGVRAVRIPRRNGRGDEVWVIDRTIELPSDIEIFIDDAHLVLATGGYLNMFSAIADFGPEGSEKSSALRNIYIHGSGRATLDGGEYNGLSERNFKERGIDIYRNTSMIFFNVDGLRVENISVINQRWWGITNIFVSNALFRNIHFDADFSRIDKNGVHHPGERPITADEIYVKNADGIDLRIGCHHVLIENITGFTEDDSVALTALGTGEMNRGMFVKGEETAIHDVRIKNVVTDCYCSNVRLLNGNGHRLYNIELDGIASLLSDKRTQDNPFSARNSATVRIGDVAYTRDYPGFDDVRNITVRNIFSETNCAVTVCNAVSGFTVENVIAKAGYAAIGTYRRYFLDSAEGENFASGYNLSCEAVEVGSPVPTTVYYVNYRAKIKDFTYSNVATLSPETETVQLKYIDVVD